MKKFAFFVLAVIVLAAFEPGCGVKTAPKSARSLLPAKIPAPRYGFSETGRLIISFRAPEKDLLSKPLENLGGFYLDRAENKLEPGFCPNCPVTYTQRIRIRAEKPTKDDQIWGGLYTYEDTLKPGFVYHYRIFATDAKGRYDRVQFRLLEIFFDTPSRPPDSIVVRTADKLVVLTWPPPDRLTDGRPLRDLAGYDLYRRTGPDGPWTKLNADQPWTRTSFEDRLVENGQVYYYKIKALRYWHGTRIDGAFTPVVEAVPVDLTPPPPPANLMAVSIPAGINLNWTGIVTADMAGYRIYRRTENEDRFIRLNQDLVIEPSYLDNTAEIGRVYIYRVTAVDNSEAANESEPTQDVTVLHEP